VKRSTADGYTFLFGTNSALAVVPNIRKEPPYDVMKDFTPITYIGDNTFFIVVHPSVPAKSIAELIAHAKANPKAINYVVGNTYAMVATSLFAMSNGVTMHAVSYRSEPDALPDPDVAAEADAGHVQLDPVEAGARGDVQGAQIGVAEGSKRAFREEILIRISSLARRGQTFTYGSHERLKEAIGELHVVIGVAELVKHDRTVATVRGLRTERNHDAARAVSRSPSDRLHHDRNGAEERL